MCFILKIPCLLFQSLSITFTALWYRTSYPNKNNSRTCFYKNLRHFFLLFFHWKMYMIQSSLSWAQPEHLHNSEQHMFLSGNFILLLTCIFLSYLNEWTTCNLPLLQWESLQIQWHTPFFSEPRILLLGNSGLIIMETDRPSLQLQTLLLILFFFFF
jgi:hypothetical protein